VTTNKKHHEERHVRVRGIRGTPPDLKKLAGAVIALAQAQAEAEAEAQMKAAAEGEKQSSDPTGEPS
jgi:hypothetical protein